MSAAQVTVPKSATDVWRDILSPKFIRFRYVLMAGAAPHGERAILEYGPARGQRVLDVGCGFGDATLALADRVGPAGSVIGLDVADDFFAVGDRDRGTPRPPAMHLVRGDATTYVPTQPVDLVFSRFGTMFFERPLAAFRNLHAGLAKDGRLVMTTWRPIEDNPWLYIPKQVALSILPPPPASGATCGPGPFSLAGRETVTELLTRAGFRNVALTRSDSTTLVGRTMEEAIAFQLAVGPAGEIVREAGAVGQARHPELFEALTEALAPYRTPAGIALPSSAWIVSAQA